MDNKYIEWAAREADPQLASTFALLAIATELANLNAKLDEASTGWAGKNKMRHRAFFIHAFTEES